MNPTNNWYEMAPQIIYEAYPDHDLLPIEPPGPHEKIGQFKERAENAGDTLFLFLCREADDDIDVREYVARLNRAIGDIQIVQEACRESPRPTPSDAAAVKRDVTIRLALDADWIELSLTYADARGRRSGSVSSSLHSSDTGDDQFNAAMDAIESLVLAHVCAGIDVTDPRYVEGLRTCIDACENNLQGGDE
jgi:hypothetical protein